MSGAILKLSTAVATAALAASVLAACSGNSYLSTGSLGGAQAPKPVTPSDRALYNAANIARAQRCGFVLPADQLRANYLAAETQAGTPPDVIAKVTREFDYTRQTIAASIAKDDGYCTEGRNLQIKRALARQIAGDFNPPIKAAADAGGILDASASPRVREVFNPEGVFDPREKSTKKVEE
jgi:hypothetical protein